SSQKYVPDPAPTLRSCPRCAIARPHMEYRCPPSLEPATLGRMCRYHQSEVRRHSPGFRERQLEFLQVDVHLLECLTAVHGHLPPESAAVRKIGRPIPASVRPVSKSLKKAARTVAGHSGAAAKNPPIQWGLPAL